ncbi:hypothetical protein SO694_00082174 [Aureococcus anophagefferens]|uniref:Uncharacterized protein n=1 Tax=Aureococcus anophagefferens TaxID=44056 RepID=A0ABR1FJ76_AURAN
MGVRAMLFVRALLAAACVGIGGAQLPGHEDATSMDYDAWAATNWTGAEGMDWPLPEDFWYNVTDDADAHAMFFILSPPVSHMGQFMAEKPVRRGKARGRRLETLDIGDDFCTSMNINADTAPSGDGFNYGGGEGEYPPSKPCAEGTGNCPSTGCTPCIREPCPICEYDGSIFKLGNDAVSFDNGKGKMQYLVAWGWTNDGASSTDDGAWDYWMATCLYTTYKRGLYVNEGKKDIQLAGTQLSDGSYAVECDGCFVDLSAKVTIAFKYLYNSASIAQPGDGSYHQDYDIQIKAEGGFSYNLDFSMQAPEFDLGQEDWQITDFPDINSLTLPVYPAATTPTLIDLTIQPSGDVRTKGKISSSGGKFEATASLDTNINAWACAWATYDDDGVPKMGYGTGFAYEPQQLASGAFELDASTELSLGLAPNFTYALKVSLGEYGASSWKFELSTTLLLDLAFVVKAAMTDEARVEASSGSSSSSGSSGGSSGGDDDGGLDAASTAGVVVALIVVCVAAAPATCSPSANKADDAARRDDDCAKAVFAEAVVAEDVEDAKPDAVRSTRSSTGRTPRATSATLGVGDRGALQSETGPDSLVYADGFVDEWKPVRDVPRLAKLVPPPKVPPAPPRAPPGVARRRRRAAARAAGDANATAVRGSGDCARREG